MISSYRLIHSNVISENNSDNQNLIHSTIVIINFSRFAIELDTID